MKHTYYRYYFISLNNRGITDLTYDTLTGQFHTTEYGKATCTPNWTAATTKRHDPETG